jgi:hypothetical protein
MPFLLLLLLLLPAALFGQNSAIPEAPQPAAATLVAAADTNGMGDLFRSGWVPEPGSGTSLGTLAPLPKLEAHPFFDRENLIGLAVHTAIRSADAAQTCAFMGRTTKEAWLPMKSCPAIAAYSLSMVPAQMATSYLLHRRGYHRLERWTPYLWAAPSAAGIAVSVRAW